MQFFTNRKRGFTLIELLVVIAIIGILATIVLVSLTTARNKAKDAKVQTDISQIRGVAEMIYSDNNNNYTSLCEDATDTLNQAVSTYGTQLGNLETDLVANSNGGAIVCEADADEYCVRGRSNVTDTWYFCADYQGFVGTTTVANCPADVASGSIKCK